MIMQHNHGFGFSMRQVQDNQHIVLIWVEAEGCNTLQNKVMSKQPQIFANLKVPICLTQSVLLVTTYKS